MKWENINVFSFFTSAFKQNLNKTYRYYFVSFEFLVVSAVCLLYWMFLQKCTPSPKNSKSNIKRRYSPIGKFFGVSCFFFVINNIHTEFHQTWSKKRHSCHTNCEQVPEYIGDCYNFWHGLFFFVLSNAHTKFY